MDQVDMERIVYEDEESGTEGEEYVEGTNESETGSEGDDPDDGEEEEDEDIEYEDDEDEMGNGDANTDTEEEYDEDSNGEENSGYYHDKKPTGNAVRTCALLITVFFIGVAVGVSYLGGNNHEALIDLANKYPILNVIGDYFHTKSVVSSDKDKFLDAALKTDWDWNDAPITGATLFTDAEIVYSEEAGTKPLLVILGNVFDVSSNYESYKVGSGYHGFIGQDGSRAFVTGDFTPAGLISDLDGLKLDDYIGLVKWLGFYFKTYPHMGYLIGRFYDKNGKETPYFQKLRQWVKDGEAVQAADGDVKKQFPPCNMEWSAKTETTEYWCSKKSGGIERDWEGYPYQFKESDDKSYRCACINPNHLKDSRVKPYDNCPPKSSRCKMHSPKN